MRPMNKEIRAIQTGIRRYAEAYGEIQRLQQSPARLLPPGDQKTGSIGEFYVQLYLRGRYPKAALDVAGHSEKAWDIRVRTRARTWLIQTKTRLGEWKAHVQKNPMDIRRPFVASQAAVKLLDQTLLGAETGERRYRFQDVKPESKPTPAHTVFVSTKPPA